jgi:isoquinoline 1-oxidoreductase
VNATFDEPIVIEPERYEFFETPERWETTRRDFFKIAGAGVIVAILVKDALAQPPGGRGGGRGGFGGGGPTEIGAWVHIAEDGAVTAYTGKVEIGQNIRTSLAQVVAEELRLPAAKVKMVMADTALVPPDAGTFGSQTTPQMANRMRRVAASLREVLLELAAEQGNVDKSKLTVADGKVTGPGGVSFDFGKLTAGKKILKTVAEQPATTPAANWTVAGTSAPKANGRDYVTGKHHYASDVRREGMLFGKVLRPSSYGAKLTSIDTVAAEAVPGVKVVKSGEFVGVVAPTSFAAEQALNAIKAEWQAVPQISNKELFAHLKETAGQGGGRGGGGRGGGGPPTNPAAVAEALKTADKTVTAQFTIAYIAHFPLEPRAAVAEWAGDHLTVWTGTQRPFGVRSDLARAIGTPETNIHVIVPDMGSGYGGKHQSEAANEAARLSKAVGKPVKVVWTREEEFTWAYLRPAGVIDVAAGVKADGTLVAWDFHNYNSGGSAIQTPYAVPNQVAVPHNSLSPLRQGSYRGLAATANHFARESTMDDLAATLKMDPLEFRIMNLRKNKTPAEQLQTERLKAVLLAATKQFGWGAKPGPNRGVGLALGTEKGSYVATCAEVEIDKEKNDVRVVRAVTAFECGAILNPEHLKNQVEGAVIQGLGGALFEQIEFAGGKITNADMSGYRVPRFRDAPVLETVLLDRKDLPSAGAGETPIVGIAPAVGNAIFQATGKRIRSMPMVPNGLPT